RVVQQTRHWNEDDGRTHSMRSKEEAFDYRYFPEPDLVPVAPDDEWRAEVERMMPRLPADRRDDLATLAGVTPRDVALLVELDLDELVSDAIGAGADPVKAINRAANELASDLDGARRLSANAFAEVVRMEADGEVTATQAKQVIGAMLAGEGDDPRTIAKAMGFEAMDTSSLEAIVDEVIAENPEPWERFKAGDQKVTGMFVGQVMRKSGGKADGNLVNQILRQRATGGG
ncbi:MAG TPA: Asp-tRNA(Asn)/Glu-tRNA(Gln) amidotransferase subunit GatB, partial [Acidimicrobiales bacterium]